MPAGSPSADEDDRSRARADSADSSDRADGNLISAPQARVVTAVRWVMLLALGALAVAGVARAAAYREKQATNDAAMSAMSAMSATARAASAWRCPMHPTVVGTAGQRCPVCGMELVARPGQAMPAGAIGDTSAAGAATEPLTAFIDVPATVAARERSLVQVTGHFTGWIEKLEVAEAGRRVERGQVLATVYSPELIRAQKTLLNARRWERNGEPNIQPSHDGDSTSEMFAEARFRVEAFGLDGRDIDTILEKGVQRTLPIRAPAGGIVIRKDAVVGGYVQPGSALFTIADLSTVSVLGDVLDSDVRLVTVGQDAQVRLRAYPDQALTGKVAFVAPVLDGAGGSAQVRVDLPNPDLRLRPGSLATLRIFASSRPGRLAGPTANAPP